MDNIDENIYKIKLMENTKKLYDMIDMLKNKKSSENKYYTLTAEELQKMAVNRFEQIKGGGNDNSLFTNILFGLIFVAFIVYFYYSNKQDKNVEEKKEIQDNFTCSNGFCKTFL